MHRAVITWSFLLLACSCGHHSALISEDLGGGYVLQAIDAPEDLALSDKSRTIVEATVLGYAYNEDLIIVYKKSTKTIVSKKDGSVKQSPHDLDLKNRPQMDGGLKINWYYY